LTVPARSTVAFWKLPVLKSPPLLTKRTPPEPVKFTVPVNPFQLLFRSKRETSVDTPTLSVPPPKTSPLHDIRLGVLNVPVSSVATVSGFTNTSVSPDPIALLIVPPLSAIAPLPKPPLVQSAVPPPLSVPPVTLNAAVLPVFETVKVPVPILVIDPLPERAPA